jgi:hypothetical protein
LIQRRARFSVPSALDCSVIVPLVVMRADQTKVF